MPAADPRRPPIARTIALTMAIAATSALAQEKPPATSSLPPSTLPKAKAGEKTKKKAKTQVGAEKKKQAAAAGGQVAGPGFQEEIRKTVEQRRRRRARRAQAAQATRPPGAIVPWPMPPALIIRQTPEVHDEVESLLGQLRRGG